MTRFFLLIFFLTGCATSSQNPVSSLSIDLPFELKVSLPKSTDKEQLRWELFGQMEPSEAAKFLRERRETIVRLLEPNIDPYKGDDSFPDLCKIKNLPRPARVETPEEESVSLSFYSSDRYVVGLCSDPKHLLKTQYLVLYCRRSTSVYIIRYFYGATSPWRTSELASCR